MQEIQPEEITTKDFYIHVRYNNGTEPYVYITDNQEYLPSDVEKLYKIKIPYKLDKPKVVDFTKKTEEF